MEPTTLVGHLTTTRRLGVIVIFFASLLWNAETQAQDVMATFKRASTAQQQIQGLTFDAREFAILFRTNSPTPSPYVLLLGQLTRLDCALISDDALILGSDRKGGDDSKFALEVSLAADSTEIEFKLIDPLGKVTSEKVYVTVPNFNDLIATSQTKPIKKHFGSAALGWSIISYSETNIADVSLMAISLKGDYRFLLKPPRWDAAANIYINAIPFGTSGTTGAVRYIGANIRAGYVPTAIEPPWNLSLMGGLAYNKMLISGTTTQFGFKNLLNLQFYPVLRRSLARGRFAYGYLKIVPGSSFFNWNPLYGEKAFGFGYGHPIRDKYVFIAGFDFSFIKLLLGSDTLRTISTTFSAGVGF